jgi:hypothetical protein
MRRRLLFSLVILLAAGAAFGQVSCSDCPPLDSVGCQLAPQACEQCWETCYDGRPTFIRRPTRRAAPEQPETWHLPREVGVNLLHVGVSCGPIPWWSVTCHWPEARPMADDMEYVADLYDINAFAFAYDAHPWEKDWENPRRVFRSSSANVIMFHPEYWGYTGDGCSGDVLIPRGVIGTTYPTEDATTLCNPLPEPARDECINRNQSVYDGLYQYYRNQKKVIIVATSESDWDMQGIGCRNIDGPCPKPHTYSTCEEWRADVRDYLVWEFDKRQAAARLARQSNQDADLLVLHAVEVNFFGTRDWQTHTVACDVIPRMKRKPDIIALSLYDASGGVAHAVEFVQECTGMPIERIIVSEVGTSKLDKQYDRIYNWIDEAFTLGIRLAFVWDVELPGSYDTGFSIVDRETGEWYPGMEAVQNLNLKWREQ